MDLQISLRYIPGIGSRLSWKLNKLNLSTVSDLINHYPFRYDDFSVVANASTSKVGERVTLTGEIWSIKNIYTRSGKILTQAIFNDGTTPINLTWFNQRWLDGQIKTGDRLQVSGKLTKYKNKLVMMMPVWEKLTPNTELLTPNLLHTGRLVPVYPETEGLTSKWIRAKIDAILPKIIPMVEDPLPESVRDNMLSLPDAIQKIHFPPSYDDAEKARERLSFDELFYIQLATQKTRREWKSKPTVEKFLISNFKFKIENFVAKLPFKLTGAQKRVVSEITKDLESGKPMNRLVQGEVGSGKTVVAAITTYITYLNGYQTIYMAPTEILAFQHFDTLKKLLEPLGLRIGIYTGSRKKVHRQTSDIIIGTHAVLSDKLLTDNVGLIIVDEQQRFGVEQRSLLRKKAKVPHFLTMTATPIPRTVLLTLYGDLDLSIIDEMPKGRIPPKTYVVPSKKRADAYKFIAGHVKDGEQVYIITPLIEESETITSVKAARVEYQTLKEKIFPHLKLGLLHGRLKSKEKEKVINDFRDGSIDILVSTSVVEVGMDIQNATIMVVEGAERFGLAQLHQLRGRVGRGEKQSYCLLFPSVDMPAITSRLKNLEKEFNGLKLAELDLKIRGGGEIFGSKQSGRFDLNLASFSDLALVEKTREAAKKILDEDEALEKYPKLRVKLESLGTGVMPD